MGAIEGELPSQSVINYGLSYIRPYHREIARRLVLGQTQAQISRSLGIGQATLSILVNSPLFKMEVRRLEQERDSSTVDVTKTLRELSPIALETVERTMYSAKNERLRFEAATDILDRSGFGKQSKMTIDSSININYSTMSDEELRLLALERMKRITEEKELREKQFNDAMDIQLNYDKVIDVPNESYDTQDDPYDSNNDCSMAEHISKIFASNS